MGIRPHEVLVDRGGISAKIDLVEPMGSEAHVHTVVAGQNLIARVDGERARSLSAGETIQLSLPADRMYVFDATGETLVHAQLSPDVRAVG